MEVSVAVKSTPSESDPRYNLHEGLSPSQVQFQIVESEPSPSPGMNAFSNWTNLGVDAGLKSAAIHSGKFSTPRQPCVNSEIDFNPG